jgi:hypothetical protein
MSKDKRTEIAEAFDDGRLNEAVAEQEELTAEERRYLSRLGDMEEVLRSGTHVTVPRSFAASVVKALPSPGESSKRLLVKLLRPALFVVTILLSIVFAEPLGLKPLMELIETSVFGSSEFPMAVLYMVVTCGGILVMLSLILSNMYSIRSRRVEH